MSVRVIRAFAIIAAASSAAFGTCLVIQSAMREDNSRVAERFEALACMAKRADAPHYDQQVHRLEIVGCGYDQGWAANY